MNIQDLVNNVMTQQMTTLGAESVDFDGTAISMVLSETRTERDDFGGERFQLLLTGSCPTTTTTRASIIEEDFATVRGVRMKIAASSVGAAMTEVNFEEAAKIKR